MRTRPAPRRLVAALAGATIALAGIAMAPDRAAATVRFQVGAPLAVRGVPQDFVGLSLEYRAIPGMVGSLSGPVNPLLVQLIRNLAPTGRPVLRIGGQSGERSWWPVTGLRRPLGITYDLSSGWMADMRALAAAVDANLVLGVGLEADNPRIDSVEVAHLEAGISRRYIGALELGNEPELYRVIPWYRRSHGRPVPWYDETAAPVFARGPGWSPATFVADYARTLPALPRLPLAGPSTGQLPWLNAFAHAFLKPRSRLRVLTWHAYGLDACVTDPANPQFPTVPHLLSTAASRGWSAGIGPDIGLAHRDGARFEVDEAGSASCDGLAGVSNSFASALWVLDTLFTAAAHAVDGVQLHTFGGLPNNLFDLARAGTAWSATVHSLYYGALMFARAVPAGSRLLGISSSAPGAVRAWAVRAPGGGVNVVLINDGLARPARVSVTVPHGPPLGQLQRLRASSAYATAGATLGGRSFTTHPSSGVLAAPVPQAVRRRGSSYTIIAPPASAALLTLPG